MNNLQQVTTQTHLNPIIKNARINQVLTTYKNKEYSLECFKQEKELLYDISYCAKQTSYQTKSIQTVNGLCSSGKTFSAGLHINNILNIKNGNYKDIVYKVLIAQPTKDLVKQTYQDYINIGISKSLIHVITSETSKNTVKDIINTIKHINETKQGIILTTHKSLEILTHKFNDIQDIFSHCNSNGEIWDIIIDEIISVTKTLKKCNPFTKNLIKDFFVVDDTINNTVYDLALNYENNDKIQEFIKLKDNNLTDWSDCIKGVLGGDLLYTNKKQYDKVFLNGDITLDSNDITEIDTNSSNTVMFTKTMNIDKYAKMGNIILMAANIDKSMFYNHLKNNDYKCVKHEEITKLLRFQEHDGKRLHIITSDKKCTKVNNKKMINVDGVEITRLQYEYNEFLKRIPKNAKHGYIINNDITEKELVVSKNAKHIRVMSQGLNCFKDLKYIFIGCAMNLSTYERNALNTIGFDNKTIKNSMMNEWYYQGVMRGIIRDIHSNEIMTVYISDKDAVEYLCDLFIGATISYIDNRLDKKVVKSKKEMMSNNRFNIALNRINECLYDLNNTIVSDVTFSISNKQVNNNKSIIEKVTSDTISIKNEHQTIIDSIINKNYDDSNLFGLKLKTFLLKNYLLNSNQKFQNKYSYSTTYFWNLDDESLSHKETTPLMEFICDYDSNIKSTINNYKVLSKRIIKDKINNGLANHTIYLGNRTKDNALLSNVLILDIDNGDLTPEVFLNYINDSGIANFAYSTAGCCKEKLNNFRVHIFCNQFFTSEQAKVIYTYFIRQLEDLGYYTTKNKRPTQESSKEYINKFNKELTRISKKHNVSIDKIKLSGLDLVGHQIERMFYVPAIVEGKEDYAFFTSHYESEQYKNTKKFKVLDINEILKYTVINEDDLLQFEEQEKDTELQTIIPEKQELNNINKENTKQSNKIDYEKYKEFNKIQKTNDTILGRMCAGNRSNYAVALAHNIHKLFTYGINTPDGFCLYSYREYIRNEIISKGIDKNALKSFDKYSGYRN